MEEKIKSEPPEPKEQGDSWVTVKHGSPFPSRAVRAMDRELDNNVWKTKNCFVAKWQYGGKPDGEPVYGRAWNNNGQVEAWFYCCYEQFHSKNIDSFDILTYHGPPEQNFRYVWNQVKNLKSTDQPVGERNYVPAVIPKVEIEEFTGELLGKAHLRCDSSNPTFISVGYGGREVLDFDYDNSYVLCREPTSTPEKLQSIM